MPAKKPRLIPLHRWLVHHHFSETTNMAKQCIEAGGIQVNGQICWLPSRQVSALDHIKKTPETHQPVSRGYTKLSGAWQTFQFDITGKIACDIGVSTGGFSEFLLQKGACHVYGVDVGVGDIHSRVRHHSCFTAIEKTNARYLNEGHFVPHDPSLINLVVMDVSFISVTTLLPVIGRLVSKECDYVVLFKPQFEAKKDEIQTGGVISSEPHRLAILQRVKDRLKQEGFISHQTCESPIYGQKAKNKEYFLWIKKGQPIMY